MALVHSLQVCGVRSFSPDSNETITFNSPVTLLLGQNGCGKTTIIESICYALTGELPTGSSNGQGFLNDPKMSHKRSTKGSIKIKFLDCLGNCITVCRSMTVSMKADGGLTFKRLDTTIRQRDKNDPNNQKDISGRCIDVDSYCATALNVSKSILNNVIFCHQENSTWPLDEPKKLKEKFDQIFDAVRYNKCIENTRKMIKESKIEYSLLLERLQSKKKDKDNVEKLASKCNEQKEKLESISKQIKEKSDEMIPMETRFREILDLEDNIGGLQRQLAEKEVEKKGVVEQQKSLRKQIPDIFEGSDEELQQKIDLFESEKQIENDTIAKMESDKNAMISELEKLNQRAKKKHIEIGQLKEERRQFENKMLEFNDLIEKVSQCFDLGVCTNKNDRNAIINDFKKALQLCEDNFKKFEDSCDETEINIQKQIDDARDKFTRTTEKIKSNEKSTLECRKKIKVITNQLTELETSDTQLKLIDDSIKKLQKSLANYNDSFKETVKQQEIEEIKEIIRVKEQNLDKLERQLKIHHENYATEQKIESQKSFLIEKQGAVTRLRNHHLERFQKLFGDDIPTKNFRKTIEEIHSREEQKCKTLTKTINKLENELVGMETKLKMKKNLLDNDKKEVSGLEKKVVNLCGRKSFKEILQDTYKSREKLQRQKGQYNCAQLLYEEFAKKFEEENPCCPICKTDFTNKKAIINDITNNLKAKAAKFPSQLDQTITDLNKVEELYNKLQQLKPVNDQIEIFNTTKIPKIEKELEELNIQSEEKSMELLSEREELKRPQEIVNICKEVISEATLLDQYYSDINRANEVVKDLERNIMKVPSNRSKHETEAEIDSLKSELSNQRNRLDSLKETLENHRNRCQNLNREIQNQTQKQLDMQMLMNEKPLLLKEKAENTETLENLSNELERLQVDRVSQEKELIKVKEEFKNITSNNKKLKQVERNKLVSFTSKLSDMEKLYKDMDRYERNNMDQKLKEAIDSLAEIEVENDRIEREKQDLSENISRKQQSLASRSVEARNLNDNILLRDHQKLETKLSDAISELKKKIGGYNYRIIFEEKRKLEKNIADVRREVNLLSGQESEKQLQIKDIEKELNSPQNKNAHTEYKKQSFSVKMAKLAVEDLTRYVNALEYSVLKFHEERMVQINRIIRDLWRNIYRGNDIDYIEIKTDVGTAGASSATKRVYNYRVVQVKNDVELEMRGRCSAGQKVLACLVIRMALAETFSTHCGILALDEPTTNLDKNNILSLSDALSRIITSREKEQNFQLLIITHDEEFLETLTKSQTLDSYYKVTRNHRGFSVVEKHYL